MEAKKKRKTGRQPRTWGVDGFGVEVNFIRGFYGQLKPLGFKF